VTYNSLDLIEDCINSIIKHNDLGQDCVEIIIVDNSDSEASKKLFSYVKKLFGSRIILIKNEENLGYGQGNNVGIEKSKGKIICVMNPDIRLTQPLFATVENEFNSDKKLCLLGFKQRGGVDLSYYLKPQYSLPFLSSFLVKFCNKLNLFFPRYFFLSGAFMFLNKQKFEEVGKFDEKIFMFFEEADIAQRIDEKGYYIKFIKHFQYLHLVGDRNSWSPLSFRIWLTSLNYFLEKNKINKGSFYINRKLESKISLVLARAMNNRSKAVRIKNELEMISKYENSGLL
jgi:GT2 family glycosyltransferase